jgi:hypothetical protein
MPSPPTSNKCKVPSLKKLKALNKAPHLQTGAFIDCLITLLKYSYKQMMRHATITKFINQALESHTILGFLLLTVLLAVAPATSGNQQQRCLMNPARVTMRVPEQGFRWLEGEGIQDTCNTVPNTSWVRVSSKQFDLLVHTDGPSGSGRYWEVTVALTTKNDTIPTRGFCFETNTVGWRTLQQFNRLPLRWVEDRDGDGKPELIIWDSFPLNEKASLAEYGLVAWVYQVDSNGIFMIDWKLSQQIAGEIAAAYRTQLKEHDSLLQGLRNEAAKALEVFATGKRMPKAQRPAK